MLGEDYVYTLVFNDEICVKNGLSISALIKFSLCFVLFYFFFFYYHRPIFSWRSSLKVKATTCSLSIRFLAFGIIYSRYLTIISINYHVFASMMMVYLLQIGMGISGFNVSELYILLLIHAPF